MGQHAIIVENDESKWADVTGSVYQYPNSYKSILSNGCKIVYYKGRMRNPEFRLIRLSVEPHYFGIGIVGDSIEDPESSKGDRYCEILQYQEFEKPVSIKIDGAYLEEIPDAKKSNHWRYGVREISKATYDNIVARAKIKQSAVTLPSQHDELESFAIFDGKKTERSSARYERNPFYRIKAISIHGTHCMVCGFDFYKVYGDLGLGFIHVHHNKPVSLSGPTSIDPRADLSVLCANCHAMIHRNKQHTMSVDELKRIVRRNS